MLKKITDLFRLLRPHQWVKNLFVFAGIIFSHMWTNPTLLTKVALAAAAFALISSTVYIFNDIVDRQSDALHPTKKNRPIVTGAVKISTAILLAILLGTASLSLGFYLSSQIGWILIAYILLSISYTFYLKHIAYLDILAISSGFLLRIFAGTFGVGIRPSMYLIICSLMLTLFLSLSKRYSEQKIKTNESQKYTESTLLKLIYFTGAGTIFSYLFYSIHQDHLQSNHFFAFTLTVPLVSYGILRYIKRLRHENPNYYGVDVAKDLFTDSKLLITIIVWAVLILNFNMTTKFVQPQFINKLVSIKSKGSAT